jgi:hypothetical protein
MRRLTIWIAAGALTGLAPAQAQTPAAQDAAAPAESAAGPAPVDAMSCTALRADSDRMQAELAEASRETYRQSMAQRRSMRRGGSASAASILGGLAGMIPGAGLIAGQAAQMAANAATQAEQAGRERAMADMDARTDQLMEASFRIQELEMAYDSRCGGTQMEPGRLVGMPGTDAAAAGKPGAPGD